MCPNEGRLTLVLGPTNTGKTHLAVERMLGHTSGIIGLPLRLLAREIYDRVVARRGPRSVALITGEEKIVPPNPSYYVSTVEAMPLRQNVAFVAVDEIQLCADPERGHVFTDRLLRVRGREETMFLGAQTIGPILRHLLPDAEVVSRPRFSKLIHTGVTKLSRLPRRSAIVAFSANDVYALAELIRRQKGGAAVVMGALSPRTRNAQVALYQDGAVDYLVATDAIGMGLNMDIDHVAFASLTKFDGQSLRRLRASEIAQIAGRAGRHMNDGSFGTLGASGDFSGTRIDSETSERIEQHRFKALRTLNWRSSALDFRSASALIRSLNAPAPLDQFARMSTADDLSSLKTLAQLPDIADIAKAPAATARLWDVCRIPDFRKTMADVHARLLAQIYRHLMTENGVIPADWMARHVSRLDRTEGDIDTLAGRIAHIRTWTYVANRPDWLDDPGHWRERTRAVEDKLSDALHDRLSQRFVDKRAAVLMRRLGAKEEIFAVVKSDGDIMVEDQFVGQLKGLRFVPDPLAERSQGRLLLSAAVRALAREIDIRVTKLEGAGDGEIELKTDDGLARPTIWWREGAIARIVAGADKLSPRVRLLPNDLLDVRAGKRTVARLQLWLDREIARRVAPLIALHEALVEAPGETAPHKTLSGPARGLTFQMIERLGWVRRADVWALIRSLSKSQRARLRGHGVRFGAVVIFMPSLLKPGAAGFCQLLWAVHAADPGVSKALKRRRISIDVDTGIPPEYYRSAGYLAIADRAYRIDRLERLAGAVRKSAENGMALSAKTLMTKVRCDAKALAGVLEVLGYEARPADDDTIVIRRAKPRKQRRPRPKPGVARSLSPFAGLAALKRPRRSA